MIVAMREAEAEQIDQAFPQLSLASGRCQAWVDLSLNQPT